MDRETREYIKQKVNEASRRRAESGYMNCDPETLTRRANEAEALGFDDVAEALVNFRDKVVNVLLGEGWDLARIEAAVLRNFERYGKLTP